MPGMDGFSQNLSSKENTKQNGSSANDQFILQTPELNLPKGGGALKNIDEKFQVNAANGTASFSVPLPFSKSRNDFSPAVSLQYNSGSGNSVFGLGWDIDLPCIQRKTDKQLPQYKDAVESDVFLFSGVEDLVPVLKKTDDGNWIKDFFISPSGEMVQRYRPRIEVNFTRIEKITPANSDSFYWRISTSKNIVTIFGMSVSARIADPADAKRVYKWLPELSFDDRGNCLEFEYVQENLLNVADTLSEQNRFNKLAPFTNTYLKRIKYGNKNPYQRNAATAYHPALPVNPGYLFEAVFDYGDHDDDKPIPSIQKNWPCRKDPFSNYKAGFEIRTYRLCRRVLFYHYFKELNDGINEAPCLVRSVNLGYKLFLNASASASQLRNAEADYIISVSQSGYIKKSDGSYSKKSPPPVEFSYQELQWDKNIHDVAPDDFEGDPVGLDKNYQWADLWGEGISGILTEQADAWFYKSNLGNGHFSSPQPVMPKPSFKGMSNGALQLQDLEADGRKFIVSMSTAAMGYFEISDDNEWMPFQSFAQRPNVDFSDANTKFIDLDGDGRPELIISEENVFTWYANKGTAGYDSPEFAAKPFDEEQGPAIVFRDEEQSIYLSPMSGSGLTDIVRIRNGEVCYWPNLGYGKFGAKVNMDFAPFFDTQDQFNPSYLNLADINGTGVTDILYLGDGIFRAWLNLCGNAWGEVQYIDPFPDTASPNRLSVMDFTGNGTASIVWSSPLPLNAVMPIRYIDLMGGNKPYIMTGYKNNFGKEVSWDFKSSSQFYIEDKLAGRPWITKLPFPVQCVAKTKINDVVAGIYFTNEYSYHHGYYDHAEREFRGFGRVEQTDTEDFSNFILSGANNVVEEDLHQPPVKTITWYHTGAYFNQQNILDQFAHEYNRGPFEFDLPKPLLPDGLNPVESREALRACKGMMLRQEIYGLDGNTDQSNPYAVATHNNIIKLLQPKQDDRYTVFYVHESESVNFYYERNLNDPRIAHSLNLEVDDFGNVLKSASIVYGRKMADASLPADVQNEQRNVHIIFTENDFTNDFDLPDVYALKTLYQTKTHELTQLSYNNVTQFNIDALLNDFASAAIIKYEDVADGSLQKRLIKHLQHIFLADDLVSAMPAGQKDTLGLVYQAYKLVYTPSLINNLYGSRVTDQMLADAGYVKTDSVNWWQPSGRNKFLNNGESVDDARNRFFFPVSMINPLGTETIVTYDGYQLILTSTEDLLHNRVLIDAIDYRTLSSIKMIDVNDNTSEVITDELGMVIATSVYGNETDGLHGDGPLSNYTVIEPSGLAEVIANPYTCLQQAGSFFYYDLFAWQLRNQPVCFVSVARETHISELKQGEQTKVFLCVGYTSGLGQNLQTKVQAEPGPALKWQGNSLVTVDTSPNLRWIGNGRTIFNNKGNPVKQYESFFSTTYEYESEEALVTIGFSSTSYYDPTGRVIRILYADGSLSRTEFDAWEQLSFDRNDTVLQSSWYSDRGSPDPLSAEPADPETRAAWLAAKHANTPRQAHTDSLGRPIYNISDNGPAKKYHSTIILDIENNQRQVIDARNNVVMEYGYDMVNRRAYQHSMDGADRWMFTNVINKSVYAWDSRSHRLRSEYDPLNRPLKEWLKENIADSEPEKLIAMTTYGEGQPNDKLNQLRGRNFRVFDPSGMVENGAFDFKGNVKNSGKRLAKEYQKVQDWNAPDPFNLLENEIFSNSSVFNALNRAVEMTMPDGSKVMPLYNETNLLNKINVFIQNKNITFPFVQDISYNAKAQREQILYGNNTTTRYGYDEKIYRLKRLLTTRNSGTDILQDLNYTYDPVGNITAVQDAAQQTVFFNNAAVDASNKFEYDAIYRLMYASGREHAGQNAASDQFDNDKTSFNNQRLTLPGDMNAMQRYEQRYEYDEAGNMLSMIHNAGNGIFSNKWSRVFYYNSNNNQLSQIQTGADITSYHYDAHGNMSNLQNGSFGVTWNYADQLQQINLGGGGFAYYVYDNGGQRVRKIIENGNLIKERIYFGAFEVYREIQGGTTNLERQTLHIMDDKNKIAMVETRTIGNDNGLPFLIRYQYTNHQNTATLETDDQANIISYEEYYPFGSTAYEAARNQTDTPKRYRYTGKERDEESGLYYHGARYYAPWLARWVAADPIGIEDGLNVYTYVSDNPVVLLDPHGTDGISVFDSDEWKKQKEKALARKLPEPLDVDSLPQIINNQPRYANEFHYSEVGIAKSEHVKEYLKMMTPWFNDYWNLFDRAGKVGLLQSILNTMLAKEGLPPITIKEANPGESPHFSRSGNDWSIYINSSIFGDSDISAFNFSRIAATAYHEARHSEQSFRAIEYALQTNKEIPENEAPPEIIEAAKKAVKDHPLVPGSDEYKFAAVNYEYDLGEKKSYQRSVYQNQSSSVRELEEFEKKNKDSTAPWVKETITRMGNEVSDWFTKYRHLPGESDSFLTMEKVYRLWNNRNKPAPFNSGLEYAEVPEIHEQKIPDPIQLTFPR